MKKILNLLLIIPFLIALPACDDELDRLWEDPNYYTPAPDEAVPGLFLQMQKTRFWQKDYGENYYFTTGNFRQVWQVASMVPYSTAYCERIATGEYGNVDAYMGTANNNSPNRFNRAYTEMRSYMYIRDEVNALEGTELYNDQVIYAQLATVLKNVVALQTVDLFNSIPYFDAFKAGENVLFTKYDDPLEIYKDVINTYAEIAAEIPSLYAKMSDNSKATFKKQDLFFQGDVDKWVKYINSEIVRSCVRMSGIDADFIKPYLAEAVKNLPEGDYVYAAVTENKNRIGTSAGGVIQRAIYELLYYFTIPDVIMCRMNRGDDKFDWDEDDPRLPTIAIGWTPDGSADYFEYYGISQNWERQKYLAYGETTYNNGLSYGKGRRVNHTYPLLTTAEMEAQGLPARANAIRPTFAMNDFVKYTMWSYYNPVTFVLSETPNYITSRAETDMFLAEAVMKGYVTTGKTPGEHMKDAVIHSTDFWYMMNSQANYAGDMSAETKKILTPDKPAASIIENYANVIKTEFEAAAGLEDKMEIIGQQKYIHLNIWGLFEPFTELRRTRHPKLEPVTVNSSARNLKNEIMMVERLVLPTAQRAVNMEYYSEVMADDYWTTPIFWVPQDKINETYFRSEAIKPMLP